MRDTYLRGAASSVPMPAVHMTDGTKITAWAQHARPSIAIPATVAIVITSSRVTTTIDLTVAQAADLRDVLQRALDELGQPLSTPSGRAHSIASLVEIPAAVRADAGARAQP